MTAINYRLEDRYLQRSGPVHLTGIQAVARLPIEQLRIDAEAGLTTAALISGYPGSPLAGLDSEIRRAVTTTNSTRIIHQPAVNEELAATAVMGSQLAATRPDCRYDGVVGVWYGKAPGLDRATDALRHAVFCGTSSRRPAWLVAVNRNGSTWHLHPPVLRALGPDRKIRVSARFTPLIRSLAAGKRLRGSFFDPFGRAELRRLERELADDFPSFISAVANALTVGVVDVHEAAQVLALAQNIRGFEDIKMASIRRYQDELAGALAHLDTAASN